MRNIAYLFLIAVLAVIGFQPVSVKASGEVDSLNQELASLRGEKISIMSKSSPSFTELEFFLKPDPIEHTLYCLLYALLLLGAGILYTIHVRCQEIPDLHNELDDYDEP